MHKITPPFKPLTPTAIVIDLDALVQNYKTFQNHVGSHVMCSAVVKADAYGIGMTMAASTLQDAGCQHFFVASIDEGLDLRSNLGDAPDIFILSGLREGDEDHLITHNLVPVLNDLSQVNTWNNYAKVKGTPLPAILHLDTGMMRTGLKPDEIGQLGLSHVSDLELKFVMSHLSCAYDPQNPTNQQQLDIFDSWRRSYPIAPATLANSGGVFLGERYHMDMVRPGLGLYGSSAPCPDPSSRLKPVVKVYAQILQVGPLLKGHSVGYDGTYTAARPSRIATLGIGYGDGYLTSLSNKGLVCIAGHKVPVIGKISMDLTTVDVTDIPPELCQVGDWAEIMGDHISLDDVAKAGNTIPWEILTSLSRRAHRYYKPVETEASERVAS